MISRLLRFSIILCGGWVSAHADPAAVLFKGFKDPPAQHSLAPYWFWNGPVTEAETRRQMLAMMAQGVREATVFPWDGMQPRYLSEEFWKQIGAALRTGRELGFTLNLADDYNWPTAQLWDFGSNQPELSVVLQKHPVYRMRRLAYREWTLGGGESWAVPDERPETIIVARLGDGDKIEASTLREIDPATRTWTAPSGRWLVTAYRTEPAVGGHNTRVDILNPDAVRLYIDLFYGELARRYSQYFGKTLKLTIADHEGAYGSQIAWTPALWNEFRKRKGYEGRTKLPLLARHSAAPEIGQAFRRDYLDVISGLYTDAFTKQVTDWCTQHGIKHGSSMYEEQIYIQANGAGDMFRHWRASTFVMIDALLERGRMPIDFLEAASAAHFENMPLVVENQGLQGHATFFSLEKARYGTNALMLWGPNKLCPYFLYDPKKVTWPPHWFLGQPLWSWMRDYSNLVRRASYMNSTGRHVAPVAIYYPLETAFAHSEMLFTNKPKRDLVWNNLMDHVQNVYTALQLELDRAHLETHIMDSGYMARAEIRGKMLRIGSEEFHALILPPLTHIERTAADKIKAFAAAGGRVIATGTVPAELKGAAMQVFDLPVRKPFMQSLDYMNPVVVPEDVKRDLEPVIASVQSVVPKQPRIEQGNGANIRWSQRQDQTARWHWMVNDSADPASVRVNFPGGGALERWDPVTGERQRLDAKDGLVELNFGSWDAFYVVRLQESPAALPVHRTEKVLAELPAAGWRFRPEEPVKVPYATDRNGNKVWLAPERLSNRAWWLIGPFPYDDHRGFYTAYPPEKEFDPQQKYKGAFGEVAWTWRESPTYSVTLRDVLKTPSGRQQGVYYASAFVHSPVDRDAQAVAAFADGMKAWINGTEIMNEHRHPKWLLMRDSWAERRNVRLRQGWNRILLKIEPSLMVPTAFMFRLTAPDGRTLRDVRWASEQTLREQPPQTVQLDLNSPPGTGSFIVPRFDREFRLFVNGRHQAEARSGAVVDVAKEGTAIRFEMDAQDQPEQAVEFRPKETGAHLFRWTATPLAHYSGSALYAREFDVPPIARGQRLLLDLGAVGLAAEVWVNGRHAGQRAWLPYRFDITALVRPGKNSVRIRIANSDAGWQSQGDTIYPLGSWGLKYKTELDRLPTIAPNGLEGPVRLIISTAAQQEGSAATAGARQSRSSAAR